MYQLIGLDPHFGVSIGGSQSVDVCCYGFCGKETIFKPQIYMTPHQKSD